MTTALEMPRSLPVAQPVERRPQSGSILERLQEHARLRPADAAFVFPLELLGQESLSWFELEQFVSRFAGHLRARGAADGDVVLVLSASVREQILGFLAAIAAGCVPTITSYPSTKQSETAFAAMLDPILERAAPRFVVVSRSFAPAVEGCCHSRHLLLRFPELSELPRSGEIWPRALDHTLFLQFSSGTTGLRKAVAVTGDMLLKQVTAYAKALELKSDDCVVSWLPLYHDMGLVASLLCSVWHGVKSVHASPFDWLMRPELLFEWIGEHRGTLLWLPNFAYDLCADRVRASALEGRVSLDSLRAFINCSEPVRERSHARFLRAFGALGVRDEHLQACYAMAETTFAVTQSKLGAPLHVDHVDRTQLSVEGRAVEATSESEHRLTYVSCGQVLDGSSLRIANTIGERQVGEIEVLSSSGFGGYWFGSGDEDPFTQDGWYRTGDIGYIARGELYVTGRSKDLIINRGQNIYPSDLEDVLVDLAGCKPGRVVVFGVENEETCTEDIVVMVERLGPQCDDAALAAEVRERLIARVGYSAADVVVCEPNTLLKSTSGKLSRGKNRELYQAEHRKPRMSQRVVTLKPPTDPFVRSLVEIWERALVRSPVDPGARLFAEIGADSLSAMRAVGDIADQFRVQLSASDLLQEDTILRQAAWLRARQGPATAAPSADPILVRLQDGDATPLFLLHPAGGRALPYTTLLSHLSRRRTVYAFQAPELFGAGPHLSVAEMTAQYLERLLRVQPKGPFLLGGWSFGGLLAHDLACRLESMGHHVAQLVLFDTDPPLSRARRAERRLRSAMLRACIARGLAPHERIASPTKSLVARFLAALPAELDRPEELAAVMRFAMPARFGDLQAGDRTVGELWEILLQALRSDSHPEEMRGFFLPELDAPGLLRGAQLLVKNRYLSWAHAPRARYRGPIEIFAAANPERLDAWQPHCTRKINVRSYPVRSGQVLPPHFVMLDAANVALFGRDLQTVLEKGSTPNRQGRGA